MKQNYFHHGVNEGHTSLRKHPIYTHLSGKTLEIILYLKNNLHHGVKVSENIPYLQLSPMTCPLENPKHFLFLCFAIRFSLRLFRSLWNVVGTLVDILTASSLSILSQKMATKTFCSKLFVCS